MKEPLFAIIALDDDEFTDVLPYCLFLKLKLVLLLATSFYYDELLVVALADKRLGCELTGIRRMY